MKTQTLNINESFICRIWEGGERFYRDLLTCRAEKVEVLSYGTRNFNSGPDYSGAKVRIGGKMFHGGVEVHRTLNDWKGHRHRSDRRYNRVVLQVVMWDSGSEENPKLRNRNYLPTVVLSRHLTRSVHEIWQEVIDNPQEGFRLQCFGHNRSVPDDVVTGTLDRLSFNRLILKAGRFRERLKEIAVRTGDYSGPEPLRKSGLWEQVLYEYIFEALGFSKNKVAMLKLSQNLNLELFRKYGKNDINIIQAILFGAAGMFFDLRVRDGYAENVKKIWNELKEKLNAETINREDWLFFRLRPRNFPTLRIAAGSHIVRRIITDGLLKKIILAFSNQRFSVRNCSSELAWLIEAGDDPYWSVHYMFGRKAAARFGLLGKAKQADIIVNVVIPLVYLYSVVFKNRAMRENVMEFYRSFRVRPDNTVITLIEDQLLKGRGIKVNTASREQAAVQLYNFYCMRERCGECGIGMRVLEKEVFDFRIIIY